VNLRESVALLIAEVLPPLAAVDAVPAAEVPSKVGLMVPDAWMRVDVGLKGTSKNKLFRVLLQT
jgi:hypothetical protein